MVVGSFVSALNEMHTHVLRGDISVLLLKEIINSNIPLAFKAVAN